MAHHVLKKLSAALGIALILTLTLPFVALADDVYTTLTPNDFSATTREQMALSTGGATGNTQVGIFSQGGDQVAGCNIQSGQSVAVKVTSTQSAVATAVWSSTGTDTVTFSGCVGAGKSGGNPDPFHPTSPNPALDTSQYRTLVVTSGGTAGTATIKFACSTGTGTPSGCPNDVVSGLANSTAGTYNTVPGRFDVITTAPPRTRPRRRSLSPSPHRPAARAATSTPPKSPSSAASPPPIPPRSRRSAAPTRHPA